MGVLGNLVKLILFKSLQYFWTAVTALTLLKERIQYGSSYFEKKQHPKPACLEGWDSRYIQLDSVRLHYVQTGQDDAPLMLFIHGYPEFWYSWRFQLRHFCDKYRCVAVDQRGYNLSDKPKETSQYHADLLVNDMHQLIRKLGHDRAIVVAHDWGAIVAWRLAMMFPLDVERLVILNVPHPRVFSGGGWEQMMKSWYVFMFQTPLIPEMVASARDYHWFDLMFRGKKAGIRNKKHFTDEDLEAWKHVFSQEGALTPPINYYRCLPQLRAPKIEDSIVQPPTLIVWGTGDAFLVKSGAEKSMQWCRDGRFHLIEGASHWVMQDEPGEVNRHIRMFLDEGQESSGQSN